MFNIAKLFFIPYVFAFFTAFYAQFGSVMFSYAFVSKAVFFVSLLILKFKEFMLYLVSIFKKTSFRYFVYFYIWVIISGIICMFTAHYSAPRFLYSVFIQFIIGCLSIYLMTGFIFPKYLSLKTLIRFLVCMYLFIFFFGFLEYIGQAFNISAIQAINDFFVNQRLNDDNYTVTYIGRVKSIFVEPAWYANFICLNLPIIYQLTKTKFRIFKNKFLNIFSKTMLLPFAIVSIILTKSPIWLLIFIVILMFCFHKKMLKYAKQMLILLMITVVLFFLFNLFMSFENINSSYIYRIAIFFKTFNNLDEFVVMEPSLANRVISYIFTIKVFLQHPIIGVGFANVPLHVADIISSSYIPLTQEMTSTYTNYMTGIKTLMNINSAILYNVPAETGIIGFVLVYTFFIKTFIKTKNCVKYLFGIEKAFAKGAAYSILIIICISGYDTFFNSIYLWLMFGIALSCYRRAIRR